MRSILCVDDEEYVLDGLKRTLFDQYDVTIATSGAAGLQLIKEKEFSVVISDMRMPEMNGAQFLSKAKALAPDTTRMLLTGHSDLESAISAINDGNIFRFLLKPCPEEKLLVHISDAIRLYDLIKSERDLLENTLKGSIKVLSETLSIVAPTAFSRSVYIKSYVAHMAKVLNQKEVWEFEIAAMLSQVGAIILPPELLEKAFSSVPLEEDEKEIVSSIPSAGAKLVGSIPRLGNVARMINYQQATDDEFEKTLTGKVLLGTRMLRIANSADRIILREGTSLKKATQVLAEVYTHSDDQALLSGLASFQIKESDSVLKEIGVSQLKVGMVLDEDVLTSSGSIVLCKGQELNSTLISRLVNFAKGAGVEEPIKVYAKP